MSTQTLHHPRHAAARHLTLALRLAVQIVTIGLRGLLFLAAHRALPAAVRLRSPGFAACSAMFFAAAALRHGLAGNEQVASVLLGTTLAYAALWLVSLGGRTREFVLCLCISVAVDLLATALALGAGLPLDSAAVRDVLLAWPLAAVFVALVRLRLARRARPQSWLHGR